MSILSSSYFVNQSHVPIQNANNIQLLPMLNGEGGVGGLTEKKEREKSYISV